MQKIRSKCGKEPKSYETFYEDINLAKELNQLIKIPDQYLKKLKSY